MLETELRNELKALEARHQLRCLPAAIERPGPTVRIDGRELLCLSSNNYLGLATHPALMRAACEAVAEAGCSATGSRLLSGNLSLHERLEARLACFKRTEAALLFNSGYAANLGVLGALAGAQDLIVADKLNHASLIDGARATGATARHVPHGRLDHVEALLSGAGAHRRRFVVTDGVFSMDGDIAPLQGLLALCRRHDATLILDEAHATGVLGPSGRGTLEHLGLAPDGIVQIGTLGKALGGFGAFVACDRATRDLLLNRARPLIFSTALPPAVLGAAIAALDELERDPGLVARLRANARLLREGLAARGFEVPAGETPIIPVRVGDAGRALRFAAALGEAGVLAQAVRPPAVPPGTARLRVTAMASHTEAHLRQALEAFERVGRQLEILA